MHNMSFNKVCNTIKLYRKFEYTFRALVSFQQITNVSENQKQNDIVSYLIMNDQK